MEAINIHRPACCHMEAPVWNDNYLSNQLLFQNLDFLFFHSFNRFQLITNSRHVFFFFKCLNVPNWNRFLSNKLQPSIHRFNFRLSGRNVYLFIYFFLPISGCSFVFVVVAFCCCCCCDCCRAVMKDMWMSIGNFQLPNVLDSIELSKLQTVRDYSRTFQIQFILSRNIHLYYSIVVSYIAHLPLGITCTNIQKQLYKIQ